MRFARRLTLVCGFTGQGQRELILQRMSFEQASGNPVIYHRFPEAGIHPRDLLGWFENLLWVSSPQVVETHSEVLVLLLQVAVAQGVVSPDDVKVIWVQDGISQDLLLHSSGAWQQPWPQGKFQELSDICLAKAWPIRPRTH